MSTATEPRGLLVIEGMTCASCVRTVEQALDRVPAWRGRGLTGRKPAAAAGV